MARFDVYRNEGAQGGKRFPYLLAVQTGLLENLSTTVVVPLGKPGIINGRAAQPLTPLLDVNGESLLMYTPELAAVHAGGLRKRIGNLESQCAAILRALDFLFHGI